MRFGMRWRLSPVVMLFAVLPLTLPCAQNPRPPVDQEAGSTTLAEPQAWDEARRRMVNRQIAARAVELGEGLDSLLTADQVSDEIKAAVALFAASLDERQLRLFAGVEALQFGRGTEIWIANLLGVHRQTVAKGRRELLEGDVHFERVRKKGAGRPRAEKKTPESSRRSKS